MSEDFDVPVVVGLAVLQYAFCDFRGGAGVDLALAVLIDDGGEDSGIPPEDRDVNSGVFLDVVNDVGRL